MIDEHDQRLAEALAEAGYPQSVQNKALAGYWSDFKTPLPFPKMELGNMLAEDGNFALRQRVMDGEFDG